MVAGTLISALLYYRPIVDIGIKVFPDLRSNFEVSSTWNENLAQLEYEILEAIHADRE